ncbi:MAG: hypothetical protein ACRDD1_10040 [Planctomycetia bacterium]
MARRGGKGPTRLDLRRQAEAAERVETEREDEVEIVSNDDDDDDDDDDEDSPLGGGGDDDDEVAVAVEEEEEEVVKPKKKAVKKVRKKAVKKKVESQRMRMTWGVFDNGNNQVGSFPYPDKEVAEKRAADLTAKGKFHFVQPVREPIPED